MPFIRRSTLRILQARVESYAQHAREQRRLAQDALANCKRLAEKAATPDAGSMWQHRRSDLPKEGLR